MQMHRFFGSSSLCVQEMRNVCFVSSEYESLELEHAPTTATASRRAATRRISPTLRKLARPLEHRVEHVGRQLAGERVLLAHVVRAEHRPASRQWYVRAVAESRLGPQSMMRCDRIPPELS